MTRFPNSEEIKKKEEKKEKNEGMNVPLSHYIGDKVITQFGEGTIINELEFNEDKFFEVKYNEDIRVQKL
jgi:hypothetical protein